MLWVSGKALMTGFKGFLRILRYFWGFWEFWSFWSIWDISIVQALILMGSCLAGGVFEVLVILEVLGPSVLC